MLKLAAAVILGIVVLAIARFEYRNFHDYCHDEGRYLSDKELTDPAIQYEITHLNSSYVEQNGRRYGSVEEFRQINPICCQLNKSIPSRDVVWLRRIVGKYFLVVVLWYQFKEEGSNRFTTARYLVDTCGRLRSASTGGTANLATPGTPMWEETIR